LRMIQISKQLEGDIHVIEVTMIVMILVFLVLLRAAHH